eukprot:TRINITY_DN6144_c2_g1_i1.p1 TRINITY_DN6144_c2_g1~~TRINITY_DN6144_c2_g1_i1.p1  ORF type:complete len:693 (-),score=167.77 TRINITY_DN6144_c2_g1_i1:135-2213(-)
MMSTTRIAGVCHLRGDWDVDAAGGEKGVNEEIPFVEKSPAGPTIASAGGGCANGAAADSPRLANGERCGQRSGQQYAHIRSGSVSFRDEREPALEYECSRASSLPVDEEALFNELSKRRTSWRQSLEAAFDGVLLDVRKHLQQHGGLTGLPPPPGSRCCHEHAATTAGGCSGFGAPSGIMSNPSLLKVAEGNGAEPSETSAECASETSPAEPKRRISTITVNNREFMPADAEKEKAQEGLHNAGYGSQGQRMACVLSFDDRESESWLRFTETARRHFGWQKGGSQNPIMVLMERLRDFTDHKVFELFFAFLILLNTAVMAAEMQLHSLDVCYNLDWHNCKRPAKDIWPGAEELFIVLDMAFGVVFTVEIALKLLAWHIYFFAKFWNYVDTACVIGWYIVVAASADMVFDPLLMRLARVVKLARFLRLVKTVKMFDALQLLVGSLRASALILFWSAMLLLLVMSCAALVSHQVMLSYITDENLPTDIRDSAFEIFGSFVRSFVTIYQLTFSLDTPAPSVCFELNAYFALPILLYQGIIGFAVIKVIEAVFLNETIKIASTNDDLMVMEKNRWEDMHEQKVKALFEQADESQDGLVDYSEFMMIMSDEKVTHWMEAMGIEVEEPRLVWDLLCSWSKIHGGHTDKLNVQWFVKGIGRLKGQAKSLDVLKLLREIGDLKIQLEQINGVVRMGNSSS